jgi:hypothetical protein
MEDRVPDNIERLTVTHAVPKAGRREKFVDLAQKRTKNAIKAIRVIAKLGNKNAYEFSESDINKIAKALTREVDVMKSRMLSTSAKEAVDFTL